LGVKKTKGHVSLIRRKARVQKREEQTEAYFIEGNSAYVKMQKNPKSGACMTELREHVGGPKDGVETL